MSHKVEAGQVYTIKPNMKRKGREEKLTIQYVEPSNKYFVCRENEGSWVIQLLDFYDLVEDRDENINGVRKEDLANRWFEYLMNTPNGLVAYFLAEQGVNLPEEK